MGLVSSSAISNNHKLYFSKYELSKILDLYSLGVATGSWKDYAIDFEKNNAFFYIYKHSFSSPECVLNKYIEKKRKKILFKLITKRNNKKFENIDSLIIQLKRKNFKII